MSDGNTASYENSIVSRQEKGVPKIKWNDGGPPALDPLDRARWREFKRICEARDWGWISDDLDAQERYLEMRLDGQSHNMAEILATGKFPATVTDVEWNRGHCNGSQFDSKVGKFLGDYYKSVAEEHGVNVTGKVYKSGLASFPGDPQAWVSSRGEAQAVIEDRGWSSRGLVNVRPRINDVPDDGCTVDPALIAKEVAYREDTEDMLGCKDGAELTDKLTKLRGWKPDHEIGKDKG